MKKLLITLLLLIAAKANFAQGISYGVKAGLNFSNIYSTNLNTDFKQGYLVGVYAKFDVIVLAIQPELHFSNRGYVESGVKEVNLNYIDMPILLRIKVLPFVSIDAGPQFSRLVNKNFNSISTTVTTVPTLNNSEVSAVFGASMNIWKLGASARYIVGLSELEKAITSKNQLFQIALSLKL